MGGNPKVPMLFYVYVLTDPKAGAFYVGKGCGYRITRHFDGNSHARHIHAKIAALRNSLIVQKFDCSSECEAFELERFLISEIGRADRNSGTLLNRTSGGQGSSGRQGFVHSEETKRRIAESMRGKKRRPETLSAMRAAARKRYSDPAQKILWDKARTSSKVISDAGRKRMAEAAYSTQQRVDRNFLGRFTRR